MKSDFNVVIVSKEFKIKTTFNAIINPRLKKCKIKTTFNVHKEILTQIFTEKNMMKEKSSKSRYWVTGQ